MSKKVIRIVEDKCEARDNALKELLRKFMNINPRTVVEFENGSQIYLPSSKENHRSQRSNQIWEPFIDEDGNGCCTNVLTGDTYLDWTKEELDEEL